MIIFDHEVYIEFFNNWKFKDEEGDFYFNFSLFDVTITSSGFGLIIFNFVISIYWY